jgi:hypothetical protein
MFYQPAAWMGREVPRFTKIADPAQLEAIKAACTQPANRLTHSIRTANDHLPPAVEVYDPALSLQPGHSHVPVPIL